MGKKVIRMNESELIDLIQEILGDKVNEQGSRFAAIQQGFNERTPPIKTGGRSSVSSEKQYLKHGTYSNVKVVYSKDGLLLSVNGKNFQFSCSGSGSQKQGLTDNGMTQKPV